MITDSDDPFDNRHRFAFVGRGHELSCKEDGATEAAPLSWLMGMVGRVP